MNFAFQALFFFLLLIPGLLFRSNFNGRISKELVLPQNYLPFGREIIQMIIIAALLNISWVYISNIVGSSFEYTVDLKSVLFLLMGDYDDVRMLEQAIGSIINHPKKVILYFISLYIFSAYLGFMLHKVIRVCELDKKYKLFRFNNNWHYLLTGEIMEFQDMQDVPVEVDFVAVSAVIDSCLYVGNVADYELDGRGDLALLTLQSVYRRELNNDAGDDEQLDLENDPRYYRIKGDYFLINCEKARNLNIDYWYLPEEAENE